jgi:hypothetical protein
MELTSIALTVRRSPDDTAGAATAESGMRRLTLVRG